MYGYHVSSASLSLDKMISDNELPCLQFYLGNNKTYQRRKIKDIEVKNIQLLQKDNYKRLFTHSPYCINLASDKDDMLTKSQNSINSELQEAEKIQAQVVVHMGSLGGIQKLIDSCNNLQIPDSYKYPLLLECSSGSKKKTKDGFSSKLGGTMRELEYVFERIPSNIGLCIDTAHVWGVGEYNIQEMSEMRRLFDDIISKIGIDKLQLIHLNGSCAEFGSFLDRHTGLGSTDEKCYDRIWKDDASSLAWLLQFCGEYNIPLIGETDDISDYKYVHRLYEYINS